MLPPTYSHPLFTSLNRKDISASASFSRLQVLLCCHKQIPKGGEKISQPESSTGILTCFPFEKVWEVLIGRVAPPQSHSF